MEFGGLKNLGLKIWDREREILSSDSAVSLIQVPKKQRGYKGWGYAMNNRAITNNKA